MSKINKAPNDGLPNVVWEAKFNSPRGQVARVLFPVGPAFVGDPAHAVLTVDGEPVANAWRAETLINYAQKELLPLPSS
jgi:hypothetical protein